MTMFLHDSVLYFHRTRYPHYRSHAVVSAHLRTYIHYTSAFSRLHLSHASLLDRHKHLDFDILDRLWLYT